MAIVLKSRIHNVIRLLVLLHGFVFLDSVVRATGVLRYEAVVFE